VFSIPVTDDTGTDDTGTDDTGSSTTTTTGNISRNLFDNTGGTYRYDHSLVILPGGLIPSGYSSCRLVIQLIADSNVPSGFSTGDNIYEIHIECSPAALSNLTVPITVCLLPDDGITANKQIFHQHEGGGSYTPLPLVSGPAGYVCGTTNQLSKFTLDKLTLPGTGFVPGAITKLELQPAELAYSSTSLMLEIPTLDLELPIVGVPLTAGGWDTSWLNGQAGYLQTTAFPTFAGNTVLTAHVWDAFNQLGDFGRLKELRKGDQFIIHAWGLEYTYEVKASRLVSSSNMSVMGHKDADWVTLITCERFNEDSGSYTYRRAVQAVLVSVE
jgi:LPXTG-site transpeptidase (sortase) family protein